MTAQECSAPGSCAQLPTMPQGRRFMGGGTVAPRYSLRHIKRLDFEEFKDIAYVT